MMADETQCRGGNIHLDETSFQASISNSMHSRERINDNSFRRTVRRQRRSENANRHEGQTGSRPS